MILYLLLLSLLYLVANLTITLMAGSYIVSDLGGNSFLIPYSVGFFALGTVFSLPFGKLSYFNITRTNSYLLGFVGVFIFSILCAHATNIIIFLLLRTFQGLAVGSLYIITPALITHWALEKKINDPLHHIILCFTIGPVIGSCIGGFIAYEYSWQWIFYIDGLLALFFIIFMYLIKPQFKVDASYQDKISLNKLEYLFYSVASFGIGTCMIIGQEVDWFRSFYFSLLFL